MGSLGVGKLLVIDDDRRFGKILKEFLSREGWEVILAATAREGLNVCSQEKIDVVLLDQHLPDADGEKLCDSIRLHNELVKIILVTAYPSISKAVEAVRGGAFDYLPKPIDLDRLRIMLRRAAEAFSLERRERILSYERSRALANNELIGLSQEWQKVQEHLSLSRKTDSSVLITGETGTGKSLVARQIAGRESEKEGKNLFVEVNCAAIPESLMEEEMFGHEKGAFTGAISSRPGLFELADGGTLFLDEIGEIPTHMQAKLLGVLDSGIVRRLGGRNARKVHVRVIAASNVDLEQAINKGKFRKDLFFRLSVIRIHLPPLRERIEDIKVLCEYFLTKLCPVHDRRVLADGEIELLQSYHWPGNVRELRNVIERAVLVSHVKFVKPSQFLPEGQGNQPMNRLAAEAVHTSEDRTNSIVSLDEVKRRYVLLALENFAGNMSRTARALGISRSTMQRLLRRYRNEAPRPG